MTFVTLGDLAQSFQFQRDTARLTREVSELSAELSSGIRADRGASTGGDLSLLAGLESDIARLQGYETSLRDVKTETSLRQDVLGRVQEDLVAAGSELLLASQSGQPQQLDLAGRTARERFESVIGALNTSLAGRSLFSGVATDGPALLPSEDILADLETAVAVAVTPADVEAAVAAWFGPGGAYEGTAYLGSATELAPVSIAEGQDIDVGISALDPRLRDALQALATAAVLEKGVPGLDDNQRRELAQSTGTALLGAETGMIDARATLGTMEERIAESELRLRNEIGAVELARAELVAVDPYEVATKLTDAETRLEAIYLLTSRLSQLSLVNFLR